jgi:2-oxoglutarate dehydrogenase E1 component
MSRDDEPDATGSEQERERFEALSRFGVNAALVEEIRQRYEVDPSSVDESWSEVFEDEAELAEPVARAVARAERERGPELAPAPAPTSHEEAERADRNARVLRLIHSYRARGHRIADTDPLGTRSSYFPELDPAHYGFGADDLDRTFIAGDLPGGTLQTLRQILDRLRATFCRKVGVEFTHVQDPGRKAWLRQRLEQTLNETPVPASERLRILEKLSAAELFERFLHTKFVGQKRFSLEGAEALIPLLDTVVEDAPSLGIRELVIGMAHRGRLNVLSNTLGKSLTSIFSEFEDSPLVESPFGSGDVKYHKGYTNDVQTRSGATVHLSLTDNPSHLEAVDPVVEGRARAKQARIGDRQRSQVVPILIHGDAAFAGQGIVAETLNLSQLAGYTTGGTLHVVVNNQIGFTTTPAEARSTLYCTDVAKMIQVPIFHVNGDEPEAVIHCVRQALAYRQRFHEDVVIDLVCYRRHGHNEGDEPSFTQPALYEKIRRRESVRKLYTDHLLALRVLRPEDVKRIEEDLSAQLRLALEQIDTKPHEPEVSAEPSGSWAGFSWQRGSEDPETGVPVERLAQIAERIGSIPPEWNPHPKLAPILERRRKAVAEDAPIDWGTAEALAFGSLLLEGTAVRLSGQDSVRGTFSHRHASIVDQKTSEEYMPLAHLSATQARFEAYDSLLSEAAVLGFEYGYSLTDPHTLTLWEAQFGDFANGAQVIIDQFISSAHSKWQRLSALVMLLPHGYEGQGPEHSSARIERFLQLCGDDEDNLQIANCSTAAQYFHLLRRQIRRRWRAPLVVFTPKSLLRAPEAAARLHELTSGRFRPVLDDVSAAAAPERVQRLVLCSGKVTHELASESAKRAADQTRTAVLRVEQLFPWPGAELAALFARYASAKTVVWAQEEPRNMGAWSFVRDRLDELCEASPVAGEPRRLHYAGRRAAASPAVGSMRVHKQQQEALLAQAFEVGG